MKKRIILCVFTMLLLCGCAGKLQADTRPTISMAENTQETTVIPNSEETPMYYTANSRITDVVNDPAFDDYGRLIFPVDEWYYSGETLGNLSLTWYSHIDPDKTVEVCNYFKTHADAGDVIFYDIYSDQEKRSEPEKEDTGLFFFKGEPGAKFAICNAGGGFAYVGAMHDSFPHALELSKMGYNAFALIYRPGAQTACEDLARAISFIFEHAEELEVDTDCYSLWGGSAGGRMAAYLGTYGPAAFGGDDLPRPGVNIIQYTGHNQYSELDPPTYSCVGKSDGIASWQTMKNRLDAMSALGIPTEFHAYDRLPHGFGLGTGTVAEGWIEDAVTFWEAQMEGNTMQGAQGNTVLTAAVTPNQTQTLYLWEEDRMPCPREYGDGYFDPPGFRPTVTTVPVPEGMEVKGAVLLCAGGAFQFRGNEWDCYPTAERLTEMGWQCFVVDYRLRPYTQEEGALDLARAVRFVHSHAEEYGIDPQDIAVVGYSAGGILCGEMVLNWKDDVMPDTLDSAYVPDELDAVSADVAGIGHIYSFYGRLSVGSTDVDMYRRSNLPPTFYAYGTEDPFYRQFMANADAVREAGGKVEEHCYKGQPHGFGAGTKDSNWTPEFDRWFSDICANN